MERRHFPTCLVNKQEGLDDRRPFRMGNGKIIIISEKVISSKFLKIAEF